MQRGWLVWQSRKTKGFTLIELASLLIIMVVGTAFVVGISDNAQRDYKIKQTRNIQNIVVQAIQIYYQEHHNWPAVSVSDVLSGSELLKALTADPDSRSAIKIQELSDDAILTDKLGQRHLLDGFGRRMIYISPQGQSKLSPRLISKGENIDSPTDDITKTVRKSTWHENRN